MNLDLFIDDAKLLCDFGKRFERRELDINKEESNGIKNSTLKYHEPPQSETEGSGGGKSERIKKTRAQLFL